MAKLSRIYEQAYHTVIHPPTHSSEYSSLADYLNGNKIYPIGGYSDRHSASWASDSAVARARAVGDTAAGEKIFDVELKYHGTAWSTISGNSVTRTSPLKTVGYELVEYEPILKSNNPLDNIEDEFGEGFAMFVAVVKGTNEFEGQSVWYNEDLISHEQIWPDAEMRKGLCWQDGKLPKIPRRWKR